MHPAPSSSTSRGDVVLQPIYFTSSIYVKAFRDDLATLVLKYHEAYSQGGSQPFALFKAVWMTMGWHWLHFKIFDSRSRQTFLEVTVRLFLERTVKTEAPFTRVVSLFAAYVFFYTQVKEAVPFLQQLVNIPIPYDHYQSLMKMADTLASQQIIALRPYVQCILSCLQKDQVFVILPQSDLGPMNPRDLPREIHAEDGIVFSDPFQRKKGRPARKEKGKKARLALDDLDGLLSKINRSPEDADTPVVGYQSAKLTLLERGVSLDSLKQISRAVLDRLKECPEI